MPRPRQAAYLQLFVGYCQFACEDGLDIRTLDSWSFLAMNGVQRLSDSNACSAYQAEALGKAGVAALGLSPQSGGYGALCRLYRSLLGEDVTQPMSRMRLVAWTATPVCPMVS